MAVTGHRRFVAEIPVQEPTKYELNINLRTAKALGLDVPAHLQELANELIEQPTNDVAHWHIAAVGHSLVHVRF